MASLPNGADTVSAPFGATFFCIGIVGVDLAGIFADGTPIPTRLTIANCRLGGLASVWLLVPADDPAAANVLLVE